jgi:hypothetical protein
MEFGFPEGQPGIHPPTSALTKILRFKNIVNPATEKPYSEALLLGIGGGLDAGYVVYQFDYLPYPLVSLGFRYQWNDTQSFLENLTDRLLLSVDFMEFENRQEAQKALQDNLRKGKIAIVWVDKAYLPHHQLPESLRGTINHQVAVYARDGRLWRLYIDDMSTQAIEVREKIFTTARANLAQNNFLMMVYNKANMITAQELREAIIHGIVDCATQMTHPNKNIGISNLQNWAEKLTNQQDRQGWPNVFRNQIGLFKTLSSVYESIKLKDTGGFAMRKTYADFLHEAAGILNNPSLNAIAGQYLQLANHWSSLAENALPSNIPVFDRVKSLLNKKYHSYRQHDLESYKKSISDLQALESKIITNFPLDLSKTNQLFERLASQVKLISELEASAANRLRDVTQR